jgi:malate synthase
MPAWDDESAGHVQVGEADLLSVPRGPRTEACLRHNCVVGVQYLEAWLGGLGCVPLYNLMEDAATAEICRTQACDPRACSLPFEMCSALSSSKDFTV